MLCPAPAGRFHASARGFGRGAEVNAVHSSLLIEKNAFLQKKVPLSVGAFLGKDGKRAVLSDHSVPGNVFRADMKCPADLSCHARISGKKGDLPVTDDFSGRNGADYGINPFKEVHGAPCGRLRQAASGCGSSGILERVAFALSLSVVRPVHCSCLLRSGGA